MNYLNEKNIEVKCHSLFKVLTDSIKRKNIKLVHAFVSIIKEENQNLKKIEIYQIAKNCLI